METISAQQMWRKIPPEEKFQLLARSHTTGTLAVLLFCFVFLVLALGLKSNIMAWASLGLTPVVFQRAASKRWRELKPATIISYLAVRSAARRFAFAGRARDLAVLSILRGRWFIDEADTEPSSVNSDIPQNVTLGKPVWLVLLGDCLICISETPRGARLEYGAHLGDNFQMQSVSIESERGAKTPLREFRFWLDIGSKGRQAFRFTSEFPGAMMVFEHQLQQQRAIVQPQNRQFDQLEEEPFIRLIQAAI